MTLICAGRPFTLKAFITHYINLKAQHVGLKGNVFVSTERHDALYVVGALEEAMELRGMRYHPIDIETSVIRTHKSITEW